MITKIGEAQHALEERLRQWKDHEGTLEGLQSWLSETERSLKNYSPCSSLKENQDQLEKYQVHELKLFYFLFTNENKQL